MIKDHIIICFASDYSLPPTSKHHVMHLLAERNTVLWVNYHASRAPSISASDARRILGKMREMCRGMASPRKNLYVLSPLLLPLPASRWAREANHFLLIAQVNRALRHFGKAPRHVWSFAPDISYVLGHFSEEKVLYYCVDDFASFSGYNREQVLRDEEDLCRRADLVVTVSSVLQKAKSSWNPNTIIVTHGVDYEHFSKAVTDDLPLPEDIKDIPHPILGFFGLIRDWVDLDLLANVARRRTDWHIVLLGDSTVDLAPYRGLSNMHFLGRRPYADLPAYCRHFDVGLVPFKVNALTEAASPIKLREYLAAGLPVVSSVLAHVEAMGDCAHVGADVQTFVAAVNSALGQDRAARHAISRTMASETWAEKVRIIDAHLSSSARPRLAESESSP